MRSLPRLVIALGFVSLLTDVSSEMILPLLPLLVVGGMGGGPVAVGLIDGIPDALSAVLKLFAGALSDRAKRRKPLVLGGYTLSSIVRPLSTFALLPWHIYAVRAVDCVGKALRGAPRDALIADSMSKEDAPRGYAFHRMMDHTGALLGPLVASLLLAVGLEAREAIAAAWVPGVLAVLALALFVKEKPRAPAEMASSSKPGTPLPRGLVVLLAIFGMFAFGVASDTFLVLRATNVGVAPALVPIAWSVLHAAKVAAAWLVGKKNVQSRFVAAAAWLTGAAGLAILAVDAEAAVFAGALVLGVCHGAREPIEKSLVRAAAPDDARGRAFGVYALITGILELPSGIAIGLVWGAYGGPTALLASAAAVAIAAGALALVRPR